MYVGIQLKHSKPGHSGSWLWVWVASLPPQQRAAGQTERNFHVGYKLYLPETFQCRLLYSNCLSLINGIPTFLVIHRNMKVCFLSETILTTTATFCGKGFQGEVIHP